MKPLSSWTLIMTVCRQSLLLAWRNPYAVLLPWLFVLLLAVLFPLAFAVDNALLPHLANSVIWVSVLLSILLANHSGFHADRDDGSLQHYLTSGQSLLCYVWAKFLSQWLIYLLPLVLVLPVLGLFYGLSWGVMGQIALALLLATPTLLLLALFGAALTLPISSGGLLAMLLILPLNIPVIIFGLAAVNSYSQGFANRGELAILGALLLLALMALPLAISTILRLVIADE